MANDDRILLNLVLNEATVSAVEGRVRNLVNRLNNQNISLNINGRNLDNIVNRLNDIQQRMQTINSTPVNINANLTSAQQQYRLETERMRVAQQLELSRQRTLQTENQAISALAQQNRTLTVNNNVTHQIEQGAQNIGHNMNVAGGHARDFVDYLADGVRYIVVYRSLYEIMNQIGEAFSEMKNVDKELISIRKTTGMAENEIEKIRKASYGVATEYGRTASGYLGSVSEFARGGYKELSTELAKVSLLTQNVGDVSADSANKMLLSVDAAYKLNGNVTELTNVVNGLNNIANLNPTSMQKMADGMQVSASMAKVAGLEISDLVALIGTGTAVTQREGGEIARAIRTIMMNIRQVKGELEDGTVIDDDSIAKAEAALKGVGIATKEVVNGVRELRDPMDILDELAGKWSTLNTEAQSVVLESLANKRQANVLAAILENYEMVGKMQSEYFNSANSAIKENELYLQGWEATQKRVSAKWTEYVANMADTALITGSLNALYGVLVALDTPIGRIATSIVLVNTALAVSGRLWQAIRARSIVADILSMGVAERNLGTAIQLVTGHLGRQIAQWAMSPFGMATIAVAGITLITSAIEKNSQKLEENAQKAGEAYDKVKQNMNELDDLIKQYNDLQISNEWDNTPVETKKQLHEDINRLLGDEADKVDILNGKYKETTEELFKQRMSKLPEEEKKAFDNEQAKGKSLWDTAYWNGGGGAGGYNYGTMQATDAEKKFIEKYEKIFDEKYYSAGHGAAASDYVIGFDNFDDFMMKYEEAKKMLQELYNEGMGESDLYKGLNSFIAKFDTKVGEYKTAVEELESTKAGQKLAAYINTSVGGYVDDLDEYKIVVDWIKSNFTGKDADNALGLLNSYFSEYAEKVSKTNEMLGQEGLSIQLSDLEGASDKIGTLQKAFKELSDDGYITIDTLSSIKKAIGENIDNWDEYEKVLMNAKVGSEEFNDAMTDLTYKTLDQTFAGSDLSDVTEQQIAAVLRENDVVNADAVAHEYLTYLKAQERAESVAMALATDASSVNLAIEAAQCGMTAEQFSNLIIQQILFNQTNLDVGQKLEALQQLGLYANWTAEQLAKVQNTTITYSDGKWWVNSYGEDADHNGELDYMGSQEYKGYQPMTNPSDFKVSAPKFSGGGSSSSSKADDAKKAEEDRIQKELEALKAGLEARKEVIEKYKESIDITDFGLDIAEEKDFALRTDLLNSKLSQVTAYGQAMRKEFERVSNIVPKTADQAEALASQLSTLGSNMRNNVETLRETQVAIQKLSIDAVTMSAKDNLDDMQTTLNRLEKRIELLNGDNKNDYKYTNKILNMETLLPTNADMTSRRKNRSRADQSIIKTEEETQNVLNDMFQEQIKLNDNLREEERQALLADMETMRNDMVINMQNASSDYVNYGNEVINTTKAYTKTVTDTVNSMNLVLPKPDTSKFAEACNEVEKMISNLGKGVSYEITPKSDGRGGGDAASLLRGNKKTIIKNVADGQLGVPYLWGGVTPGAGLDCSGLTQYVYRSVGVNIPRVADDQLKSGTGKMVEWNDLQVGDQMFFGDGNEATHTGIYVGNGQMIHAPHKGAVVSYSPINSGYYQQRFMGAKRYAFGTSSSFSEIALVGDDKEGKLNKIRPELIVGKDGVRLAGQNGPEFVNLESGDQVIPYEKTKQILQRSDISTPRYASGTVSPGAIAAYIRQKYPEVTDAAIAGLLGNIQQESSFVVDAKIIEAYGGGDNTPTARWGLFQLDDRRVPGWSNIVQNGTWQQQIDRALANARYENSGMGGLSKYNAWDRVLTNTNLSPAEAAKLWDDLFERSDGKSRDIRATNAEKYYTNLLNGTLENTNALNDNTSALKEELDPVKQAVEEINKYPESFEADIKKLITPVRLKEKELADTEDMTKGDKQLELFKLYLPVATEAAKNGTAKYSELLAQYNQYLADVDNNVKEYEQEIVDAYEDGLAEIKDSVYDVEKAAVEVKNNLIEAAEERNDKIDSYISARNFYGDWAEYGDTEYKAIERKIKEYDRLLQEGVITQRRYNEAIEPLKQDEVSLLKNEINSALDRRIEEIDFQSSKLSSQQTLLQAHYDIINSIAEQQHTINKELETSKSMYEYLDENTRKLLFNQEDYNRLTSKLNSINAEAIKLQDRYLKDISNAKKEDLDQITSKYQMQYDMLMKQYEVEKARLEVTKKQQQLNNVLKERNVRMFINGQWVWVANTQDVQNAKAELADANFQEQQAKNSISQQNSLNKLQTSQDRNQTQINYIESTKDRVSGSDVRSMAEILEDIGKSQFPEVRNILSKIIDTSGDGKESYKKNESKQNEQALQELLKNGVITQEQYDEMKKASNSQYDTDYLDKIRHASSEEEVRKYNTLRNEKIDNLGLPEEMKLSPEDAITHWKDYMMSNNFMQQIHEAMSPEEAKKINEFRNAKIYAWDLDATEYTPAGIEVEWESNLKNTDYSQKIREAKTLEEALKWNALRSVKIDRFNMNEDKFDDTYVEEIFNTKEQLKDNVQYWEEAEEILRNNAEDVNGALLSLLEKSIPNFKTALENSSQEIINWTKSIINNQISANDSPDEVSDESINQYASGTKYTMPGRAELGENGAETFFSRHGEYVPIPDPMFANLPSGGVVFNQEQMSNVRKLWDLANGNILQYSKYMRKPQPQSIDKSVDNIVNINGMKVDTNNSREFVEALRRFVNIH